MLSIFFFQAEDGIRDVAVTGVQTCALPISLAFGRWFDRAGVWTLITATGVSLAFAPMVFLGGVWRSEEHTSELQSRLHLVCRLLLEKKKKISFSHSH